MNYNEIAETLKAIKSRPSLYIRKYPQFDVTTSFIDGYLTAWAYRYNLEQKNRGCSLWRDIREWCCDKLKRENKGSMPDIIKEQYAELSEEDLIQKYIDILIQFFRYKNDEK